MTARSFLVPKTLAAMVTGGPEVDAASGQAPLEASHSPDVAR
jgi:hypothetical protein